MIAVCLIEYKGFRRRTKEYGELEHFAEFLSNLKYEFYLCKSVTESIFRAAEHVPGSLKKRLEELCSLLEGEESESMIAEYQCPRYLKHLKLFFVQCQNTVQYGSGNSGAESEFARNMTELRRDVQNECYKRSQANFLFAGMGLITSMPIAFVPLIKQWGSNNMSELKAFYEGIPGKLTVVFLLAITLCGYGLLGLLRRVDGRVYQRPAIISRIFDCSIFQKIAMRFEGCTAEEKARIRLNDAGIYRSGTEYWIVCGAVAVFMAFCAGWMLRRVNFLWAAAGFFFGGMFGVAITMGIYRYFGYLRRLGMEGEVLGLQSVILLLFEVPNMTILKLLGILEEYAQLFRRSLVHCTDQYVSEESEALMQLRFAETNPEFRQLASRLAVSERVGLSHAFSEIAADRQFFREQQRLDMEQELRKRAANAQIVAFAPMMFLLFTYLIIPFLVASFGQMREIFTEMEQIRFF